MSKLTKSIIAVAVVITLVTGIILGRNYLRKKKSEEPDRNIQQVQENKTVKEVEKSNFYEVKFALTSDNSQALPDTVTLPDTAMVKEGTIVGAIELPYKEGSVFMGWYYDAAGTKMALAGDVINANTTLYADFEDSEGLDTAFKINYMSSQDVNPDFGIEIAAFNCTMSDAKNVLKVTDLSMGTKAVDFKLIVQSEESFVIAPLSKWQAGDLFRVEITDTDSVRFVRGDEICGSDVKYYNFTVAREEINTLHVNSNVVFINVRDTEGVDVKSGLFNLVAGLNGDDEESKEEGGVLKFEGNLEPGTTIAVYDGELSDEGTVEGEVIYLQVTEKNADGSYNYEGAEFADVLFIPDVIPLQDDGSYSDGRITVDKSLLTFKSEVYRAYNLDENTTVEAGDFIAFYKGRLENLSESSVVGYGLVTGLEESGRKVTITYSEATQEDILESFQMYSATSDMEIPLDSEQIAKLEEEFAREAEENGFGEEALDYVETLLAGNELNEEQYSEAVRNMVIEDQTGADYSLEEIRLLADLADKVEISDPQIKAVVSPKLQHFEGSTGIRIEVSAGITAKMSLNTTAAGENQLELKIVAALEQEVVLGLSLSADADWKWMVVVPVLQSVDVKVAFQAGTYTGLGASMAITTKIDKDKSEWKKLVEANNAVDSKSGDKKDAKSLKNTLSSLKDTFKAVQNGVGGSKEGKKDVEEVNDKKEDQFEANGGVGGDLPDKYSAMLSNESKYIDIVNQKLFEIAGSPDPIHLIEFSLGVNFVVGLKVNCMMGWGISYANAKQYCFLVHINVFGDGESTCTSSEADLETPNFRADFYVFGNVGLRAGIRLDARVGVVSTKLNSVGIIAEAGLYGEVYGFLYVYYTWESGEGEDMGAMGSMLFEVGVYLKIDFCARLIGKKLNKTINIYSHEWPLLQLGAAEVPMEFEDVDKSHLNLEFPGSGATDKKEDAEGAANAQVLHSNKMQLHQDIFKVKLMSLKTGKLAVKDKDTNAAGNEAYRFVQNGVEYIQYNEECYNIRCVDLDGKDGKATDTHQLRYLPETNELYIKPMEGVEELWGKVIITYRNNTFGFNTNKISRTINVHWKGVAASAEVLYYIKNEGSDEYELYKTGEFNGFDGIQYDLNIEEATKRIPGYRLVNVGFDDEDKLKDTYEHYAEIAEDISEKFKKERNTKDAEITVSREQYDKALADLLTARTAYEGFQQDRRDAVHNQSGTLFFLMCSSDTVVRLYFMPDKEYASWLINPRGFDAIDEGVEKYVYTTDTYYHTSMLRDQNILANMPEEIAGFVSKHSKHEFTWYYYEHVGMYEYAEDALNNREQWILLDEDTVMPDGSVTIIGVEENADEFTVTWYGDKDEIFDSVTMKAGQTIPVHSGIPSNRLEGKLFRYWKHENGDYFIEGINDRMPREDVALYPVFGMLSYEVQYTYRGNANDSESSVIEVEYDSMLCDVLNSVKNWPTYEGKSLNWYILTGSDKPDEKEVLIPATLPMPARSLKVEGRYENLSYKLTWVNGDSETAEVRRHGEEISIPVTETEDGRSISWTMDGKVVKGIFTMPARDVTLVANAHEHEWVISSEEEGTCLTKGIRHYECTKCSATKQEETELNPNNHVEGETRLEGEVAATCVGEGYTGDKYCLNCGGLISKGEIIPPTGEHDLYEYALISTACCIHGNVYEYRCHNCDYSETRDDGAINPNVHLNISSEGGSAATCYSEGYSAGTCCNDCGATISYGYSIPRREHSFGAYVTVIEPTASSVGVEERECSVCHAKEQREIPMLTGEIYTIVFLNDLDSSRIERQYGEGANYSLDPGMFSNQAYDLVRWNVSGAAMYFNSNAAVVRTEAEAGTYDGTTLCLSTADTDGDRIITLTAVHSRKTYQVLYYRSNAENETETLGYLGDFEEIRYGEETNHANPATAVTDEMKYNAGQTGKSIIGWASQPGGAQVYPGTGSFDFPLYNTIQPNSDGARILRLYAIWSN